jgi:signal transduction histidine kinase
MRVSGQATTKRLRPIQPIGVAVLGFVTLLIVAFGLHGWLRWLAVPVVLALLMLLARQTMALHQSSQRACEEAIKTNLQRVRELSSLHGTLAHELNNPLAVIKGLAGLMALEPERSHERLEKLQGAVVNMQQVIEEMVSLERPLTPLDVKRIDLRAVAEEVGETYQPLAVRKNIELVVTPGPPLELEGDRDKLKHTLMNLVHNAVDASPKGEPIALTLSRSGQHARISVLDRGPGVPPHELLRIVEPGVTTKSNSCGLGLTIARALVQQHGGTLRLENRKHGGFAAHVELPLSLSRS